MITHIIIMGIVASSLIRYLLRVSLLNLVESVRTETMPTSYGHGGYVMYISVRDKLYNNITLTIHFALPDSPSKLTPHCGAPQRDDTIYERKELSQCSTAMSGVQ